MKHTSITPMKYFLIALTITLFFLMSCSEEQTTGSTGTTPTPDYMSFTLTNRSGTVDMTTALSRGSTYGLVISREGGVFLTADYVITANPKDAITINVSRSNSIDFTVNNTSDMTVRITAAHKSNPVSTTAITQSREFKLAPQEDYMSFALSNDGRPVDTTTELARDGTYQLTINPSSKSPLPTANYVITANPADAITINNTSPKSIDFTVNNTDATSVTITAKHKENPAINQTLELKLAPQEDYMSFALSNDGRPVDTTTELARDGTYQLTINPSSKSPLPTANYVITATPADAITINNTSPKSIDFTVNNTDATSVTITAKHKENPAINQSLELKLAPQEDYMSFALSNDGHPVDTTTELARASTYGLTISPTSASPLPTANYVITANPADAITINNTRSSSNKIDFIVNNTDARSVTITATHKENPAITQSIELKLAPPFHYVNFSLSNSGGNLVNPATTTLSRAGDYMLSISPTSASTLKTADYDISFSPADAITKPVTNTNSLSFRVNNNDTKSVTITATHKNNPVISKTLTLNFAPRADFMSFALNNDGRPVDTTTELARFSTYQLTINPSSKSPLPTANYVITANPADAITINNTRSSSNKIDFIVNNTDARSVTITAKHKENPAITQSIELKLAPPADFVLNNDGRPVDTTTELAQFRTYQLTINPSSKSPLPTANYVITANPADAITINNTRSSSNKIDFIVNNTDARSVTITATHKENPAITQSIELKLAPPFHYVNFSLSNSGGNLVNPATTTLSRAETYVITITPINDSPILILDYTFVVSPVDAITINKTSSNSIDFTVNNTDATRVTITAKNKENPAITQSITLKLAPPADFMIFALNNVGGALVDTATLLTHGNRYELSITPTSDAPLRTADYDITFSPFSAITGTATNANSLSFRVNDGSTSVTITATHKDNPVITESLVLRLGAPVPVGDFQQDIENATTVPNLATVRSPLTREVLTPLGVAAGTPLVKRYATEAGAGTRDGSSWVNAWAAVNLRNSINAINDASTSKVYLIMIAGGTYKPDYSTTVNRDISFSMKNHVAIMGGFRTGGGWERTGTTLMSGDIGVAGESSDNSYHVFSHNNISLANSHLYGVTITNANANGTSGTLLALGGGMYNNSSSPNLTRVTFSGNNATTGGGMYNSSSSPNLTQVTFSGNSATTGGGMVNNSSSPNLTRVTFSGNNATTDGGGMYNQSSSSPVLNNMVFSGNTANNWGGGMYNNSSSPNLTQVVFSGNSATTGGGLVNNSSFPVLNNTVFSGNTANNGGGMYNNSSFPVLNNTVFSGNSATSTGGGMANNESSPVLNNTVFGRNSAKRLGGGMYNLSSSPVLVGAVFNGNSAVDGGGMANNNNGAVGPSILNTIFFDNKTNHGDGVGPDITMMDYSGIGAENITIAGSVLGIGLANPINAIVGYGRGPININYHHLLNTPVNLTGTATFTVNGMNFTYPTITSGSSAINFGLYVRKSGGRYYYSTDNAIWYSGFSATGGWGSSGTPPANAEDMTAKDITGKARTGRPDAGVNEL